MSQNWVTNLDLCAMNGIIDYDGGAYLRGLPPRYVGNPRNAVPPMCPPPGGKPAIPPQAPIIDELDLSQKSKEQKQEKELPVQKSKPIWKKLLFAGITIGSIIFLGVKFKNTKLVKAISKPFKKPFNAVKKGLNKFWKWITKPFTRTAGTP